MKYHGNMTLTKQDLNAITGIIDSRFENQFRKTFREETIKVIREETPKIIREETRKIINGQSAMKAELVSKIDKLEQKVDSNYKDLKSTIHKLDVKLTKRLDKIGLAEAELEDDCPTYEEFNNLESRVTALEQKAIRE